MPQEQAIRSSGFDQVSGVSVAKAVIISMALRHQTDVLGGRTGAGSFDVERASTGGT
jgi:hypothetical protein